MIVRDAMFMKYNGGAGGHFYDWDGNDTLGDESLFAVLAFHHEQQDDMMFDPIDLTGRFDTNSALFPLNPRGSTDKTYMMADFYGPKFMDAGSGVRGSTAGTDGATNDANDATFYLDTGSNRVVYQGLQMGKGAQGEFNVPVINTGHLVSFIFFVVLSDNTLYESPHY